MHTQVMFLVLFCPGQGEWDLIPRMARRFVLKSTLKQRVIVIVIVKKDEGQCSKRRIQAIRTHVLQESNVSGKKSHTMGQTANEE